MKTAVVAHVFYPEMWPELAECVRSIGGGVELVVTCVDRAVGEAALRDFPGARLVVCENRGFDVWPFLKAIGEIDIHGFDAVVKLHTKRDIDLGFDCRFNGCDFNGPNWRNRLLAFCRTPGAWRVAVDSAGPLPARRPRHDVYVEFGQRACGRGTGEEAPRVIRRGTRDPFGNEPARDCVRRVAFK